MKKIWIIGCIFLVSFGTAGCEKRDAKQDENAIPVEILVERTDISNIVVENEINSISTEQADLQKESKGLDGESESILYVSDVSETESIDDIVGQEGANEDELTETNALQNCTEDISLDMSWLYADFSEIHTGKAVMYRADNNRKNIVIGVNAGHGTSGGTNVKTYCHPDMSPKVTGGTTSSGSIKAVAVSGGMSFYDGTREATVTLKEAQIIKNKLLSKGYDVLMLRDGEDVQLDNVARTVICNNIASCHVAIHWDGDGLDYDKGCFYISTPEGIKNMEPVASTYGKSETLGQSLINGLSMNGCKIYKNGSMSIDLTQTSYSTVPSVDIELGNAASTHDEATLNKLADGIVDGIMAYFEK